MSFHVELRQKCSIRMQGTAYMYNLSNFLDVRDNNNINVGELNYIEPRFASTVVK